MVRGVLPMQFPRAPEDAPGDFYVVVGECTLCVAPLAEAPNLMAACGHSCFFKKQHSTAEEVDQAINAISVSCVEALRYGGDDPVILKRLHELGLGHCCDRM